MKSVIIGCKLPHGVTLHGTAGQAIHLNGMNTSLVAGGHGLTHVPADEAAFLFAAYAEYAPFASKAIFTNETDKVSDLTAMARELVDVRTGFEGLNPDAPAPGLKPENEKQVDAQREAAERTPRPSKAPAAPADKAAANEAAAGKA